MEHINRIKKEMEANKVIIGYKETLRALREKQTKEVFVASNCPESYVRDLENAAKISGVAFTQLDIANDELGVVCRKPFSITVLATNA